MRHIKSAWWALSGNDLASVQAVINAGIATGGYMCVVFHGTGADGWASGRWSMAKFQSFIDWIISIDVECITRDEFYADRV